MGVRIKRLRGRLIKEERYLSALLLGSSLIKILKVKVKWSRYRPGVAQRVGRGIALLFHDRGTRRGLVVSSTPRPHFTPGKDPVPILQEAGWALGPVWTGGKSRPHRDSIPDHPTRIQSLYLLSYQAHDLNIKSGLIGFLPTNVPEIFLCIHIKRIMPYLSISVLELRRAWEYQHVRNQEWQTGNILRQIWISPYSKLWAG